MANSTLRTDRIGAKNSSISHDIEDFLVQENGVVKTTTNNEDLTVQNAQKLDGVTLQEIYEQSNSLINVDFNSAIRLITRSDIQAVSDNSIVVVTKDEEIRVKGQNTYFLSGATATNNEYITINNPNKTSKIKEIVRANTNLYVLYEDSNLYVMGKNSYGCLGIGNAVEQYELVYSISNVKKIVASSSGHYLEANYAFILKNDGTVWATGRNISGQLGTGDVIDKLAWTKVPFLNEVGEISDIFCAGTENAAAYILTVNGKLLSCGYNALGALGFNDIVNRNTFQIIPALINTKIKKFAVSSGHASSIFTISCLALSEDGQLFAWGSNTFGQLGTNDLIQKNNPVLVNLMLDKDEDVEELYAPTSCYNFYIKTNKNRLFGAGNNAYGQLNQVNIVSNYLLFIKVFEDVKSIHITSCLNTGYLIGLYIITNDNNLFVCGYNVSGVLGKNKITNILTAEKVEFEYISKIKQIVSGGVGTPFICILQEDGKVFACGNSAAGQIVMPVSAAVNRLTRIF